MQVIAADGSGTVEKAEVQRMIAAVMELPAEAVDTSLASYR